VLRLLQPSAAVALARPASGVPQLAQRRHSFRWHEPPHPMAQRRLQLADGSHTFRSPAAGSLHDLASHHVVQSRVIFPGAGYLEMARAACAAVAGSGPGAALRGIFFLQPLEAERSGLQIECAIAAQTFEVRSGLPSSGDVLQDAETNCTGEAGPAKASPAPQRVGHAAVHGLCTRAVQAEAMYGGFDQVGLQYGPEYRTLLQVWSGGAQGIARLRTRVARQGTQVHPADLDDALCLGVIVSDSSDSQARLPFAVDEARLHAAAGVLWAVRATPAHLQSSPDVTVRHADSTAL